MTSGSAGKRRRVVVVGAGFGGIRAVRALEKASCDIVLVDRENHHLFQPLLYQVATAALSPADIAAPIRRIVRDMERCQVVLGEATEIDLQARLVGVGEDRLYYDALILAAGATHAYFGNDHWSARAPGLKTVEDALEIRRRTLLAFEAAELEGDPEARAAKLTFVVVGGGPTGVEMAGALREIAARTLPEDFRRVDTTTTRVIIVEGQERLLAGMSEKASSNALAHLEKMGVEVRLGAFVTEIDDEAVYLAEERLEAANVIWAAGVRGASVAATLGVELTDQGKVPVEPDCSIAGHPEVFVIGDLAAQSDPDTGTPVPGVAQGAIQMGRFVGELLAQEFRLGHDWALGRPRPAFRYEDKGTLATIGRARAVADLWGRSYSGFLAWLFWSFLHVLFLIGFRNKVSVMLNWAWQWGVQGRGARLITGDREIRLRRPADL